MNETSKIVLLVDSELLRHFKAACIRRGTSTTPEVARMMGDQLRAWGEPLTMGAAATKEKARG